MRKSALIAATSLATAMFGLAAPAYAQDEGANAENPGDIIVTARRTEERLQDVPISITVFNQEQLSNKNVATATDLAAFTPSLSVNQRYGPEKASYSIRGFNQDQSTAPTVGVYFAEVVGVRAQGGTTSGNTVGAGAFTDLENVQILKGPQGTLFGRNTTGGAILLTPKKPTDRFEGYVEGSAGNYNSWKVTAALNVPVSDTIRLRAVVERNKRDGYMRNVSGVAGTPSDFNDVNYFYGRFSAVVDLTPDLENYTIVHYSNSHTNGYASRIVGCADENSAFNPLVTNNVLATPDVNGNLVNPAYSGTRHLQALSCATQLARQNNNGDSLQDVESASPGGGLRIKQWQIINTTTWKASDSLTIKNILSYGEFREQAHFDLGTSNFAVPNLETSGIFGPGFDLTRISQRLNFAGAVDPVTGLALGTHLFATAGTPYDRIVLDTAGPNTYNSAQRTLTEELQFQGRVGDQFNYVVGGYLEFSRPLGYSQGRTGIFLDCVSPATIQCANPLRFGSISESATKLNFNNHGIFAQATYKFTDQLSLTGGFRYTFDKIWGFTEGTRAGFSANATTGPLFLDPISGQMIARACTDSVRHGSEKPALDRSMCRTDLENKSTAPTWLIDLDYKVTPDLMIYGKYARGYRQGGINFTNPKVELWNPEHMDTFEVGLKSTFRGSFSGYLNIAAFYNKLRDQQIFAQLVPTPLAASLGVAGGAAIVNAGAARSYGLEVDASALFFDRLRLSANYTYLNTKVTQVAPAALACDGSALGTVICGSPFGQILPTALPGSSFTNAPRHKLSLTAAYTLPLGNAGDLTLAANMVYTSKSVNDFAAPAYVNGIAVGVNPATTLVNLNADWKGVAGLPIDAAFFVTNLTNRIYTVGNTGAWNSAGVAEIIIGQPRMWGFRLKVHFGD